MEAIFSGPEHGAMSAPLSKPSYGMRFNDSFTGVANGAPPGQVLPIGFIISLPANGELLRTIRPLVCAGKVADKGLREVQPALNTVLLQVI